MQMALLAAALIAGSPAVDPDIYFESLPAATKSIGPTLRPGALIFSAGDCLAVRVFTASPYTHVAVVSIDEQGEPIVYDSTNGVGVRKLPLERYLATQSPAWIEIHQPLRPLTPESARQLTEYLDGQLGRPYAIQQHLTGEPCAGVHCAEYATEALMAIDIVRAKQPARVSPASLRAGILQHELYSPGKTFHLAAEEPTPRGDSTCEQMWLDTKTCCRKCCRKLRGLFLCQ